MHNHIGAGGLLLALGNGVAIRPVGLPHPGLLAAPGPGDDGHVVSHHKSGVEAHAELSDDVDFIRRLVVLTETGLELARAAAGDGAQVGLQVLPAHAHAVVRHGEQPPLLVGHDGDFQVLPLHAHAVVGEGLVGQLVLGVAGVGDELPEKNFLVGVDGVDHQVQQPLGFRLELLLCHDCDSSVYIYLLR